MNARTTSLLIVLALALVACVAPVQAPQIKAPQTQTEQALPIQSEPAQNKLPAAQSTLDPWAYPDYAMNAFDLYEQHQQQKASIPAVNPYGYPDYALEAMALYQQHQQEKAAFALLNDLLTASQTPANATREQAAFALLRDLLADQPQEPIYETLSR